MIQSTFNYDGQDMREDNIGRGGKIRENLTIFNAWLWCGEWRKKQKKGYVRGSQFPFSKL